MKNSVLSWLLLVADFGLAQTVVYTTGPNGSVSAYLIASNGTTSTSVSSSSSQTTMSSITTTSRATSSTPSTTIMLPTVPYTGQALLVGSCSIPVYTALQYENGNFIEVPLIGCSDERPECCPSLSIEAAAAATTTSPSLGTNMTTTASPMPTGVISMLSRNPLSICPSDMVDIDPVCCPSGFTKWGQAILGNTPCASLLSTSYPLPSSVLSSLTSSVAASAAASSGTAVAAKATESITVIVNTVFALGLPCADDEDKEGQKDEHGGLSTGAKAGIGAGVGAGALLVIALGAWLYIKRRRRTEHKPEISQVEHSGPVTQTTEYAGKAAASSGGWTPASAQDTGFAGYGQGFVDGVKAALAPPPTSPQSPPPPIYRTSYRPPPVEAPTEVTHYGRPSVQDEAAELSGSNTNTRSSVV